MAFSRLSFGGEKASGRAGTGREKGECPLSLFIWVYQVNNNGNSFNSMKKKKYKFTKNNTLGVIHKWPHIFEKKNNLWNLG